MQEKTNTYTLCSKNHSIWNVKNSAVLTTFLSAKASKTQKTSPVESQRVARLGLETACAFYQSTICQHLGSDKGN